MLTRFKKFYSKMVSFLTAMMMTFTTAMFALTFAGTTASAAEYAPEQLSEMANQVAMLLNKEREALGLNPLYVVPYLNECAEIRAKEQVEREGHERPNGEYFSQIIDLEKISWLYTSENIALGAGSAEDAIKLWKNSPNHWANATSDSFTHTGVAIYYDENSKYKWNWVQIFTNDVEPGTVYEGQYLPTNHVIVPADNGDINGDAVINTFDYIGLVEYIRKSKEKTPVYFNDEQLKAADCFKDGIITEADAKCLMRYILGEYKSLPFEF